MFRDLKAAEAKIVVTETMKVLTERQRYVITKIYFYNMSEIEIAKELSITKSGVAHCKIEALKKMKKELTRLHF